MFLKIAGSMLVLFVTSRIGFRLAARCSGRPEQIRQLITSLGSLKSYITYANLPLGDALRQCTHGIEGTIADFFHSIAMELEENSMSSPQQAIGVVLHKMESKLMFQSTEIEILGVLGANLGMMNRQEQGNYLAMVMEQLERLEGEAVKLRDLNTNMYRYLGICGGVAIVILLV